MVPQPSSFKFFITTVTGRVDRVDLHFILKDNSMLYGP